MTDMDSDESVSWIDLHKALSELEERHGPVLV